MVLSVSHPLPLNLHTKLPGNQIRLFCHKWSIKSLVCKRGHRSPIYEHQGEASALPWWDNTEVRCWITFLWVVSLLFNYTSAHILPWPNDNDNMNNSNSKCISRFHKLFSTFHILDDACVSNTPEWGSICSSVSGPLSHFTFLCFQIIVRATTSSNKNPSHMHKVNRGFSLNLNYLFLNKGIWTKMKHKWLVRLYPAPLLIEFSLALKLPAVILWASIGG